MHDCHASRDLPAELMDLLSVRCLLEQIEFSAVLGFPMRASRAVLEGFFTRFFENIPYVSLSDSGCV